MADQNPRNRAVVQQALEALEAYATHRGLPGPCPVRDAEYALRDALAQQAEPVQRKPLTDAEIEIIHSAVGNS